MFILEFLTIYYCGDFCVWTGCKPSIIAVSSIFAGMLWGYFSLGFYCVGGHSTREYMLYQATLKISDVGTTSRQSMAPPPCCLALVTLTLEILLPSGSWNSHAQPGAAPEAPHCLALFTLGRIVKIHKETKNHHKNRDIGTVLVFLFILFQLINLFFINIS